MQNTDMDLSTCDREPIHLQPAIQDVGFLLAFRPEDLKIQVVSENVSNFIGEPYQTLPGKNLSEVLPVEWVRARTAELKSVDARMSPFHLAPLRFLDGREYSCYFFHSQGWGVLELELIETSGSHLNLEETLSSLLDSIQSAKSIAAAAQAVALGVRTLTDLDRVMMYRFLPATWHGEVIAEAKVASVHSFLGHRFPATDIPKPARELYLRNQVRFIYDSASPTSLLYFGGGASQFGKGQMDLQDSRLRAVAPVHIAYLKNMGVVSSFSIAVIVDNELWGLLTCHHLSPLKVEHRIRLACQLLCQAFGLRVQSEEKMLEQETRLEFEKSLRQLVTEFRNRRDIWRTFLSSHQSLLQLFRCSGAALVSEEHVDIVGITPPISEIQKLRHLLEAKSRETNRRIFSTTRISDLNSDWYSFKAEASGLLAARISEVAECYVMFFRPEVIQTVEWGGDPRKNLLKRDYKGEINPRNSFDTWRETILAQSLEWTDYEAEGLQYIKEIIFETLMVQDQMIRELNEKVMRKESAF